eukprot:13778792-Alexandrium_andersonii.AAC.1
MRGHGLPGGISPPGGGSRPCVDHDLRSSPLGRPHCSGRGRGGGRGKRAASGFPAGLRSAA